MPVIRAQCGACRWRSWWWAVGRSRVQQVAASIRAAGRTPVIAGSQLDSPVPLGLITSVVGGPEQPRGTRKQLVKPTRLAPNPLFLQFWMGAGFDVRSARLFLAASEATMGVACSSTRRSPRSRPVALPSSSTPAGDGLGARPHVTIRAALLQRGEPRPAGDRADLRPPMDASGYGYELLAVDDASTDGTLDVLQKAENWTSPGSRWCRSGATAARARSAGSGRRSRAARSSSGPTADLTYPETSASPEFVKMLDEDPAIDQVVGARTTEEGHLQVPPGAGEVADPQESREWLTEEKIPDLNLGPGARSARTLPRPTCGCCRPVSRASPRSPWRSCPTSTNISLCADRLREAGPARRSSSS